MMEIKQKGNRYYRYSRMQMRSFPIKKVEALELIEKGEAELVEFFITDPEYFNDYRNQEVEETVDEIEEKEEVVIEEVEPTNVVNFADKFKANQEKKALDNAVSHFVNDILPNLNMDEIKNMMDVTKSRDKFNELLMKASLRISIEKATNKGGF